MRRYAFVCAVAVLLGAWSVPHVKGQTTWYVDDDTCPAPGTGTQADPFCMIQVGIDAAVDGDECVVAPGTYNELIDFLGKGITLRSSGGADVTTIDGTGLNGSVVRCVSGEGADTVLDGFMITGGAGTVCHYNPISSCGGGMYNENSSPTATNCTFSGNMASNVGGGMYNKYSNPTVTNCTFSGNIATNTGGGMSNTYSNPTVTNCAFSDNSASGGGGMISVYGNPTVTGCTFTGNTTSGPGGGMTNSAGGGTVTGCTFTGNTTGGPGGGMYNHSGAPTVTNCTFIGNTAIISGGGMYNSVSSSPTMTNCTFSENTAEGADAKGGGMYNDWDSSATVTNCILWGDTPDEIFNSWSATSTIRFSDVQGDLPPGAIDGGGNIDADPRFMDANGLDGVPGTEDDDLRLLAGSPAIDAADNTAVPIGVTTDLDGNARFIDDPGTPDTGNGTPPIVDMGAYESLGLCGNGVIDTGEECDDAAESATCDANCTFAECGDGTFNATAGEECDDAVESVTCDSDCTIAECGDGTHNVTAGEQCDDGSGNSDTEPDACRTDCAAPSCADGVVDTGEECDDAGESATCDANCTFAECGDGTFNATAGEECDDAVESVTCDSDCTIAECGDGTHNVTAGEECDDGSGNSDTEPDACRTDCRQAWCGDGVVDAADECDDGNTEPGDGCGDTCRIEFGACCVGTACSATVEPDCLDAGGVFFGYYSRCDSPDADGDGLRNECDGCPDDPNKIEPGICGCGRDDNADSDGDGVPDCHDLCLRVDDAVFAPGCGDAIPTVSTWGLVILGLLLLVGHKIHFSRRTG